MYHPLTLPTILADIERGRLFQKVDQLVKKLVKKAVNISSAPGTLISSTKAGGTKPEGSGQPDATTESPEELMKLWLSVNGLRRGLEAWKTELEKMLSHCRALAFERPTAALLFENLDSSTIDYDEQLEQNQITGLKESGVRIGQRLQELIGEYDERIRECTMIIDGMALATQLVSSVIFLRKISAAYPLATKRLTHAFNFLGMEQHWPRRCADELHHLAAQSGCSLVSSQRQQTNALDSCFDYDLPPGYLRCSKSLYLIGYCSPNLSHTSGLGSLQLGDR